MSRSIDEWVLYGKQQRRCFYFYEEKVLDLTEFILQHPGGKKALANYINKDITQILFKVFPHKKDQTLKTLFGYIVGTVKDKTPLKRNDQNLPIRSETPRQKKKVCFQKKFVCDEEQGDRSDESETIQLKRSVSSKKKSSHSKSSNHTSNKQKKSSEKSNHTPVKTIQQRTFEQDSKFKEEKPQKKKHKKQKERISNSNIIEEQLDQQKPSFRVPILTVKHMNQIQNYLDPSL